jgi:hypothetical protein
MTKLLMAPVARKWRVVSPALQDRFIFVSIVIRWDVRAGTDRAALGPRNGMLPPYTKRK